MSDLDPIVGNWYRNLENRTCLEVVALDEDGRTVEVQYQDGDVEEIDLDTWYELVLEAVDAPEDWAGAFDELDEEDLGYSDARCRNSKHDDPFREFD